MERGVRCPSVDRPRLELPFVLSVSSVENGVMPSGGRSAAFSSGAGEGLVSRACGRRWSASVRLGARRCLLNKLVLWWIGLQLLLCFSLCRWHGARDQRKEEVVPRPWIRYRFFPPCSSSLPRRSVAPACGRGVEHAGDFYFVKSPRRRRGGDGESSVAFFNKRLDILLLLASLPLLDGRGGGEEKKRGVWWMMSCSYPGGDASALPAWKRLVLLGTPWWSSSASNLFRCFSNKFELVPTNWLRLLSYLFPSRSHGGLGENLGPTLHNLVRGCSGVVMLLKFGEHTRRLQTWRPTMATNWAGEYGGVSGGICSSCKLHCYMSGCASLFLQAVVHDEYAFLLFGTCRRRVRASLLRFLRFNNQEPPDLSSVMPLLDLQLNPLPQRRLPTRLLVEPLALRLARLREALEEYDYRCVESEFSTDPLAGSDCTLRHNHHVSSVVSFICVQLGKSVQGGCCNLCAVSCCFM